MADLRTLIQNATGVAFDALGTINRTTDYFVPSDDPAAAMAAYDAAGNVTEVGEHIPLKRAVWANFKKNDPDRDIVVKTDRKVLIPAVDLKLPSTGARVDPQTNHKVTDETGRTWKVMTTLSDPADAAVILQVRAS